ncbi:hypothetical protein PPERSA_07610 [Pseudocohnilembus persalinus]|uniref:Uncharacterized protein n=1 Tax=Pseudocohnilembus persalinus TaxID=266149 RepID=A0A0V0QIA9_PSEPJ|nr:hypothetical protein PPERSA_07610 [Pseudocohnilembus persalinus]|eukprot:KRX01965.1 hypothetical protein PPERSA_07610 [Pseudocohnilembus persalinus]
MIYNFQEQIKYTEIIGNLSHDARNILALKKRLEFPELAMIDTAVATIEGQAREVIIIFERDQNNALMRAKEILRSIYRNVSFLLKSLENMKDLDYQSLEKTYFEQLKENLNTQLKLITHIDTGLNSIYCNFVQNLSNFQKDQTPDPALTKMTSLMNFAIQPNYKEKQANLDNLIAFTRDICNRAHHMQSKVCPLQSIEKNKEAANQVINQAGQIENQTRAMLASFDKDKQNFAQIANVVTNQNKALGVQIANLKKSIKQLEESNQQDMANYLTQILSWIQESQHVYDQVQKNQKSQLEFVF